VEQGKNVINSFTTIGLTQLTLIIKITFLSKLRSILLESYLQATLFNVADFILKKHF
jgi:hypothetical protein